MITNRTKHQKLTPRIRQVVELVYQGRTNKQIARQLGTAEQTVKNQLRTAFSQLDTLKQNRKTLRQSLTQ